MITGDNEKNIDEIALEYMEEKYGEKFEYSAPCGNSYTGTRTFFATCESLDDFRILVQIDNYKEDNRVFRDNYLSGKYIEETRAFFKEIGDEGFGECRVFYSPFGKALSERLPADAPFEQYLSDKESAFTVLYIINEKNYTDSKQLSDIAGRIASSVNADTLNILLTVVTESEYPVIDEETARNNVVARKFVDCVRLTRHLGEDKLENLKEESE